MYVDKLDFFLTRLSLMFRRYFLDMRLTHDFSNDKEVAQVTISKVSKDSGVSLVPVAIFAVSETLIRFVKLDLSSEIDFVEYPVSSFFESRCVILYVVFTLIKTNHPDFTLYEFLSKVLSFKIEGAGDIVEYFLKVNEIPYARDPDFIYIYEYGNLSFYHDAISFFSTESVRVVYKVNTQFSNFMVVCLIIDSAYASLFSESITDDEIELKVFEDEIFKEEEPEQPVEGEEDMGGFGGFDNGAGFEGGEGGMGGGGNSNVIPVEGGGAEVGGGMGTGGTGFEGE